MTASDRELVGVATAHLRSAVTAVGGRVYYHPPPDAVLPYVVTEDTTVRRADVVGLDADEVDLTIHVWTDGTSGGVVVDDPLQQARAIANDVAEALHGYALNLPGNRLVTLGHRNTLVFYDQDNVTGHGVVQLTGYIDRA